ncbi:gamma-glutamylcyclotransferase family protein [Rhizorhapis sp.]|uniref:gamma-glutamylcyclotransferase family protein n=1 Tax=Rhizorhapis sp. TaxID=1968842 RepID=UPI002B49D8FF|nr:gamma-glutamylcyclotransferase family protein [Rhizorhapis sp.]HKR16920.1 gamma-glutamylcyclotransferase family protein [Rhizorhapis sp.]
MAGGSSDLLFVYGSLRQTSGHPMAKMLRASADLLGEAWVRGRAFRVDWYPGLTLSEDPEDRVNGDLFRLHNPGHTLPLLDHYEECSDEFPPPHEYRRELVRLWHENHERLAWAYIYQRPVEGLEPWTG